MKGSARKKSILIGGLGTLAAGVWIRQLLPGEEPVRIDHEVSAEQPGEVASVPASEPVAPGPSDRPDAPPEVVSRPGEDELLARLEVQESNLAALAREGPGADLVALFARLAAAERPLEEELQHSFAGASVESATAPGAALTRLAEFAARNPLTGLVHGPDRSAALLGHRVVRPGDALLGGTVTVIEIGAGWIELSSEEARLVIELPPFRAGGGPVSPGTPSSTQPAATDGQGDTQKDRGA